MVDMLAQIGDMLPRFRIYQKLFYNHERLLIALSHLYLDVLRFCTRVKDFLLKAKRSISKSLFPVDYLILMAPSSYGYSTQGGMEAFSPGFRKRYS